MANPHHDLIIIGAGPGGYVAAIRAAQLGMDVACVEREDALGGTCLRVGCIPSKALLESTEKYVEAQKALGQHGITVGEVTMDLDTLMDRKRTIVDALTKGVAGLFKKNGITRYTGHGRLDGPGKVIVEGADATTLEAKHILIATGSLSSSLPGIQLDEDRIGTSTQALSYNEIPEHLVVIGAGYIGLEMSSIWLRLGTKVTVLEYLDRILPGMDKEIAEQGRKIFKKQGMEFRLSTKVTGAQVKGNVCRVEIDGGEALLCDRVLVAVGRRPATDNLGLDTAQIETDDRGFIPVNDHFATNSSGIHAIGDVIGGPMLAHKAEDEGVACVEGIAGGPCHVNYDAIPGVVYTHPEIATVGKTEEALQQAGIPYRVGRFPFMANGRAKALADTAGKVKVIAHKETDRLLGVHIIGPRAGDLIAEAAVAIEFGASSEDIARSSHAHPTLSEVLKEAALATDNRALHI